MLKIDLSKYDLDVNNINACSPALTIYADYIGNNESGWNIKGEIITDYYSWVNSFVAEHEEYGKVQGDFEEEVEASSIEAFEHFILHHHPESWDYWDI